MRQQILHQEDVEKVIDQKLASNQTATADLAAASASYVQAEATATRTTLNKVLAALRDVGIIPTS
jgi:CRISPR/Cas system CSM-associated protein Csm2 small subunit